MCAACVTRITDAYACTSVDGSHAHTFMNPHGLVYSIRCFSAAPGAAVVGTPTHAFTWFPGYAWQIALCASCGVHLGWCFRSDDSTFFGLIPERLRQVDERP